MNDLENKSVTELKALAYDLVVQSQVLTNQQAQLQQQLNVINDVLNKKINSTPQQSTIPVEFPQRMPRA